MRLLRLAAALALAAPTGVLAQEVRPNFQFDLGTNFGLTKYTADVEPYLGMGLRF